MEIGKPDEVPEIVVEPTKRPVPEKEPVRKPERVPVPA